MYIPLFENEDGTRVLEICDVPGCRVMCSVEPAYLIVYDWLNADIETPHYTKTQYSIDKNEAIKIVECALHTCMDGLLYWDSIRMYNNANEYLARVHAFLNVLKAKTNM